MNNFEVVLDHAHELNITFTNKNMFAHFPKIEIAIMGMIAYFLFYL